MLRGCEGPFSKKIAPRKHERKYFLRIFSDEAFRAPLLVHLKLNFKKSIQCNFYFELNPSFCISALTACEPFMWPRWIRVR